MFLLDFACTRFIENMEKSLDITAFSLSLLIGNICTGSISMVDDLKAYAEQKYTDEEFETLRRKYDFAQPFTKESLLYRELFEQYYPGQAHMIVDFWMPNKSWAGCDVDDPSARVLANYGDSGK